MDSMWHDMEDEMERITTEDGQLIGHEDKTCRNLCERYVFCWECPVGKALKKLAEYENAEEKKNGQFK